VLDRERILAKLDELDGYLRELNAVVPETFSKYRRIETRRACERLLQISIEAIIDICHLIVSGLRLGLPSEEDDIFERLAQAGLISEEMKQKLKRMKGLRNILVHEYARVNDSIVFNTLKSELGDFDEIRRVILRMLDQARSTTDF